LKDISKFEEVLSGFLEAGATHVYGIDFRTSELRKHRDLARSLAVKHALEKANAMAKELGQKAGKVHSIDETPDSWWSSYGFSGGHRAPQPQMQSMVQAPSGASLEEGVIPGQIGIRAKVKISFQLE
jgi:uncharacterized protein